MVDFAKETPLAMGDAMRRLPLFNGKSPHLSTGIRWARVGVLVADGSRVKLEAWRIGHRWMTTLEALGRFLSRLNEDRQPEPGDTPKPAATPDRRSQSRRQRELEQAERGLAAAGI